MSFTVVLYQIVRKGGIQQPIDVEVLRDEAIGAFVILPAVLGQFHTQDKKKGKKHTGPLGDLSSIQVIDSSVAFRAN